ncbi:hypothetical protein NC651_020270 [Populus alba x Populus x berolinensis]|nr:hypothetical protein NC651_020270 [Populus alba x Populus x berolinensis]
MESVVSLPLGLHNQRLKVTTPFWRIKANSFAKGVATFISWYIPRNQNPKQDGARTAKIFIKQKMEMDGLSNLHNPSFLDYCRRLLPLHMFAQIARYMMPLTGNEMSCQQSHAKFSCKHQYNLQTQYQQGIQFRTKKRRQCKQASLTTTVLAPLMRAHQLGRKWSKEWRRPEEKGLKFVELYAGMGKNGFKPASQFVYCCDITVQLAAYLSDVKRLDELASKGLGFDYFPFSFASAMETLLHRTATFPTPKQRVFSHSNQNKSLFIASGSHSFSARPLFPSLGLRKSVIVEAKRSNKNNNNKKNKQDTHSFVAKPDEAIGPFPEAILLKEKKAQEDGRVLPEFADAEEEKLFEFLNLELQSELKVERLRHYEVVYLIHEKHEEEVGSVNEKVQDFVREKKGRIWRFNDWGMRRLAYKIQKAKNAHYILMNFELEARWINDFKNMLDKDERVIRHLVIKRDEAITEDCPPPPEFQTLQGGMDNHDEEDGVDYDDDDDEAYDEDWEAEAEAVYDDEAEGSVISLHGYKEDDDGNNEVRHSKFASSSNTRKKADT